MKIIDFTAVNEVNKPIDDMIFQDIYASGLEKEMATCSSILALEIPRGVWWATVLRIIQSWT